jgi:hypothetical protein
MEETTLRQHQEKAARIASDLEDAARRLRQLLEELPIDLDKIPEAMIDWTVCPSVVFHVHGLLSFGLKDLEESVKPIREGSRVTAASVYEAWRQEVGKNPG